MTLLIQYTLIFASVLILVALGGCFSEHSGVINLGLEGIMIMGALGGALVMRFLPASTPAFGLILLILLAAAVFALFLPSRNGDAAVVEIYRNGERLRAFPLNVDRQFTVEGDYTNVVTISGGKVAITESSCPGGDCVSCGWVSSAGRSIVCLPNGVEIRIVGVQSEVDFVVG